MTGVYLKPSRLNILSCAVAGRPGRSAYDAAVEAGYAGTPAEYTAILGSLPEALTRLNVYNGRVDAILEYLDNRVTELELAVAELQRQAGQTQAPGGTA